MRRVSSSLSSMTGVGKHLTEKFVAPGRTQVILLAHSIAEKGSRNLAQARGTPIIGILTRAPLSRDAHTHTHAHTLTRVQSYTLTRQHAQ